jgi:exonuclease VII small subunit
MTDPELRQLVESNARTAQAILEAMAEARIEREEARDQFYAGMQRVDEAIQRLTTVQEGVINLLASLDEDRPTVLRKLNSIESKVDRLLGA